MITSTIYILAGELSNAATRSIKGQVYQVPRVGGISFEVVPGQDTRMIIKHKDDEPVARGDLEAAVAKAGKYQLL
ncbi:MAG: hypothetical protein L0K41_05030 [Yaniella sp.]|uniref:hypothetical protein n=1 Tax=Yaniella sp. TaxID=2773929 RepID=UPI001F9F876D|nr:hypothetical protein [Yaniella sp.]HIY87008.1 hypothetical protein [Candidatus Yaniella excrementavium]MDN5705191.1 hypothetical protein [Yaniella sp.]MDN5732604.1 hypothetical protein [Yaniella sp.]MDN5742466.1 hypothetical protein [Yaniella sp.]MDN5816606.1 hypothetical protein [Yaniella sp.]